MDSMFIIGCVIFILYIASLLHIISKGHKSQEIDFLNDPEVPNKYKKKKINIKRLK